MMTFYISDGFPLPICTFRRALSSKFFKEQAKYGHCASKNMTYYGFQGLITISFDGVILQHQLMLMNMMLYRKLLKILKDCLLVIKVLSILFSILATVGIDLPTPLRNEG